MVLARATAMTARMADAPTFAERECVEHYLATGERSTSRPDRARDMEDRTNGCR
jgi:hypothetical protein